MITTATSEGLEGTECLARVVVCIAANEDYLVGAATVIRSLIDNLSIPNVARVYVLYDRRRAPWIHRLADAFEHDDRLEIVPLPIDETRFVDLPLRQYVSRETYARLFVADILAREKRVLYMDCDVLVRGCVEPLFNLDLGSRPIGLVEDLGGGSMLRAVPKLCASIGLVQDRPYWNAGVALLDLELWRRQRFGPKVMEALCTFRSDLTFEDQDGINVVLGDNVCQVPLEWNYQWSAIECFNRCGWPVSASMPRSDIERMCSTARIVHFAGPGKPWREGIRNPYRKEYFQVLRRTGLFRMPQWAWFVLVWWVRATFTAIARRVPTRR